MLRIALVYIFVFLFQTLVHAAPGKTILISDIDDTIKLANVPSLADSARYALDDESRFSGMAALYNLLTQDAVGKQVYYLSNAPTWLMQGTHLDFLANGKFPQGTYVGRKDYSAEVHKLNNIRAILQKEKPARVIFFGDNGERDPIVYAQIQQEFKNSGIEFVTFIRFITDQKLGAGQIGFVTPIEVSLVLREKAALSPQSVSWLVDNVLPFIVEQRNWIDTGIVSFPDFVDCADFKWSWDKYGAEFNTLGSLKKRIQEMCGSR